MGPARRWRALGAAALAAMLAAACPVPVQAQTGAGPQSVEELKAALAELRRRLAEQQTGVAAEPAEQRLRAAQQQLDRLIAAIAALRRERDGLRSELNATRSELAVRTGDVAAAQRRLQVAETEIDRLRRELAAPPPPVRPVAPESRRHSETLDGAFFLPGSVDVAPEADRRLAAIADLIRADPEARVRIVGYTDSSGDPARNQELSLARARSVRDRLATLLAVDPGRIEVEGRGPADPVADNATPEGRSANRRVVVTIEP